MRLLLARHGETDWNLEHRYQGQTDIPLNAQGRRDAHALAGRLRHSQIHAVYTSDLARARETAEIVAAAAGRPIRIDPRLREMDFATAEGAFSSAPEGKTECEYAFYPGCQLGASDPEYVLRSYEYLAGSFDTGVMLGCCGAPGRE